MSPMEIVVSNNLKTFLEVKEEMKSQFENLMKDESIPLVDRWNFFLTHCKDILPVGSYCSSLPVEVKEYLGDNFYLERHQLVYLEDLLEDNFYSSTGALDVDFKQHVDSWVSENKTLVKALISSNVCGTSWDW